jgi:hypothetical protein
VGDHYVSRCYLKRWSTDEKNIWIRPKQGIFCGPYDKQAQQSNLNDPAFEKFLDQTVEAPFDRAMRKTIDVAVIPEGTALASIAKYVLAQHYRTKGHHSDVENYLDSFGTNIFDVLPQKLYTPIVGMKDLANVFRKELQLLCVTGDLKFITSDDPITAWFESHISNDLRPCSRLLYDNSFKGFQFTLPLSPNCAISYFPYRRSPDKDSSGWHATRIYVTDSHIKRINDRIFESKDKCAFGVEESDLACYT